MAQRTAKERIEKAHVDIMKHPDFCAWSGLLFIGGWELSDTFPTACVDAAGHIYYGTQFINNCVPTYGKDLEVRFTVLHENAHKALLHLLRGKKEFEANQMLANLAADHVANNLLEEMDPNHDFMAPPKQIKIVMDPKYRGWSFKEVYNDLLKNPPPQAQSFDTHSLQGFFEGEKDIDEQAKALEDNIQGALRSGSFLAGKLGGKQARSLLDMLEPKIDWRDALRDFVQESMIGEDEASWVRPHRRFVGNDMYLPTSISETIGELVACIDTSGSVGHREMTAMVSELVSIAETVHPAGIRLIYWSDGVEGEEYYTPGEYDTIASKTKPVGGGGTTLTPVPDRISELENVQCAVVLTDGYVCGDWGHWTVPVLFAITTSVIAPIGKTVHFEVD